MNIQKLATNEMDGSELLYDHEYRRFIVAWDDENGDQIETVFGCRETAIAAFFDGRLPGERQ